MRRIRIVVDGVAGLPSRAAYVWGGRTAPVTAVVAWSATVFRLLSPLQWIKYWYRQSGARGGANLRRDIPPAMTDLYFLAILALSSTFALSVNAWPGQPPELLGFAIRVFAALLLIESISWVLYYFLVRRLVEADFVIFHPAEYLLLFPVQVAIQSALIAGLTVATWSDMVLVFVGQGAPSGPLQILAAVLAAVYLGILIATLLGSLPALRFRPPHLWYVIGGGEVTREKMLPALRSLGVRRTEFVCRCTTSYVGACTT